MFGGNFVPLGWAFCNGQTLQISEFAALFNLIGTTYGGDGQSTFALPNLQGRLPVHQGNGFAMGQVGGSETVTLTTAQRRLYGRLGFCEIADNSVYLLLERQPGSLS